MEAKQAYRKSLSLILRTSWVVSSAIDSKGWPDNSYRTNFSCERRYPSLAKFLNRKKLETYFPINRYSSRLQDIIASPKVALYYYDVCTGEMCQVQGEMKVVKSDKIRRQMWIEEWDRLCPDGIDGDEYVLLHFVGHTLKYYDGTSDSFWGRIDSGEGK